MERKLGTVRISPHVLATVARLAALSVPGVVRVSRDVSGVERWFKGRGDVSGVRIEIIDDAVSVDLYVVAAPDVNLYELGRTIQSQVARAIKDMVGMPVLAVNVHIEDVASVPDNSD
ncbi:MAG: Asp23/Gls24 family envelope stress response protein [Anaerolineae bacterium]|nr:Asp23/Gls24 family envelope stress response protein [Anaerolineae bacterium]